MAVIKDDKIAKLASDNIVMSVANGEQKELVAANKCRISRVIDQLIALRTKYGDLPIFFEQGDSYYNDYLGINGSIGGVQCEDNRVIPVITLKNH